ncbi:MAG: peptide-methionine (S)-S-oxide reductase MsrA [Burkholderiaceae bacterium]
MAVETIFLGGGCFWCLEAVFQRIKGVALVQSGYMGGQMAQPDYASVCEKKTGHAEVVRVDFDNSQVSCGDLLEVFFTIHDPTTPNRQGNDVGPQYRSIIFATSDAQSDLVRSRIADYTQTRRWDAPIVTELRQVSADQWQGKTAEVQETFWPAEDYHRDYFRRNPTQGYCLFVVNPKVIKAESSFTELMR